MNKRLSNTRRPCCHDHPNIRKWILKHTCLVDTVEWCVGVSVQRALTRGRCSVAVTVSSRLCWWSSVPRSVNRCSLMTVSRNTASVCCETSASRVRKLSNQTTWTPSRVVDRPTRRRLTVRTSWSVVRTYNCSMGSQINNTSCVLVSLRLNKNQKVNICV